MKVAKFINLLILSVLSFVVFAKPKAEPVPEWVIDLKKAYPYEQYLSEMGYGTTADEARTEAVKALSSYFENSVKIITDADRQMSQTSSGTTVERHFDTRTVIETNVNIIGVEFEKPYYVKKEKRYYEAAFINRDVAWKLYEPQIRDSAQVFESVLKKANEQKDVFDKIKTLKLAEQKADIFYEKLCFGRILHSEKAESFEADIKKMNSIPVLLKEAYGKLTVSVKVSNDSSNLVAKEFSKKLSDCGITVNNNGNYKFVIDIELNEAGSDPVAIYPEFNCEFINVEGNSVYTFKYSTTNKTVSFDVEKAKRKAYSQILPEATELFSKEFKEFLAK